MTAETFREILHRRPFEPFRAVMSSGESYNVMHPEMALRGRARGRAENERCFHKLRHRAASTEH
jgi:hypothetical protein